ncbi:uncharacterized protein HD556DRAFT_1441345 [Suillus plorans]|uniref:Uncharacterized protein n=1 Tax=Suillus plorans TaxID=116603 RepID=A0A9P7DJJ4_9AGAM|nr:uncharacterized protein HD556DRAFT_1441345 [Suillus plorans]KAG1796665.1 hypothetical protein HD556DRAFT_1441345 [Suillus plorans]
MIPEAVQIFFDMCSEPDIDGYEADTSLCVSENWSERSDTPFLSSSDDLLLDPAYWKANPEKESLMRQRIFGQVTTTVLAPVCDLESITEPESEPDAHNLTPKAPPAVLAPICDSDSITEPESEPDAPTTAPPTVLAPVCDSDSITEPESEPDAPTTAPPTVLAPVCDSDSITEPESEPDTPTTAPPTVLAPVCDSDSITEPESEPDAPTTAPPTVLAPICDSDSITEPESEPDAHNLEPTVATPVHKPIFATPSPPPPTSIYWKYVSKEEDAAWYDRSGNDDRFRAVREIKRELQALCDSK